MVILLVLLFWLNVLLLLWTYFGYPVLMYLRAKYAAQPIFKADVRPALTMVIPAYNEEDVIGRKLDNTVALTYPKDRLEVLVVDDGSTDQTGAIIQGYEDKGITLLRQPTRGGKMGAVNMGFQAAKGDIVVLSDASPNYEPDALQKLVRGFADPSVGVIVGTLAVWDTAKSIAKQAGLYYRYETALRRWESETGSTVAVHGNMFALRRTLFRPLSEGTVNDEFSLAMEAMRHGYRVVYEPDAISYDDASASMEDEFNRRARINAGRYQALFSAGYLNAPTADLKFRLFSHKLLRPLAPLFMILVFVLNVLIVAWPDNTNVLLLATPVGEAILGGQVLFYMLAWLGGMAERRGMRKVLLISVPYFFVNSNYAALIGLLRWLRGSQQVTWKKRTVG